MRRIVTTLMLLLVWAAPSQASTHHRVALLESKVAKLEAQLARVEAFQSDEAWFLARCVSYQPISGYPANLMFDPTPWQTPFMAFAIIQSSCINGTDPLGWPLP